VGGTLLIFLVIVLAIAVIPATIGYYFWLARNVAPRVAWMPPRVAVPVMAFWIALPCLLLAVTMWLLVGR
jgi:hypothetical protein